MRKPTISPSRISTYLACPVKYRWTYVDPRFRYFLRSKSYYSFGISLHAALQRFHDSEDTGVITTDEAVASLEEHWLTAGYSSPDEAAEALAEGRELIARYLESPAAAEQVGKVLFVEQQFRKDMDDFDLLGRLDRVDERDDGSLEIVDYKSGRLLSDEELRFDIAMNCYAVLLRGQYAERAIHLTLIGLRDGERTSVSVDFGELASFEEDLKRLAIEMLNREYHEVEPKAKAICKNCDFLALCKRHEEFGETLAVEFGVVEEVW